MQDISFIQAFTCHISVINADHFTSFSLAVHRTNQNKTVLFRFCFTSTSVVRTALVVYLCFSKFSVKGLLTVIAYELFVSSSMARVLAYDTAYQTCIVYIYTLLYTPCLKKNCANLYFAPCLSNMNRFQ